MKKMSKLLLGLSLIGAVSTISAVKCDSWKNYFFDKAERALLWPSNLEILPKIKDGQPVLVDKAGKDGKTKQVYATETLYAKSPLAGWIVGLGAKAVIVAGTIALAVYLKNKCTSQPQTTTN